MYACTCTRHNKIYKYKLTFYVSSKKNITWRKTVIISVRTTKWCRAIRKDIRHRMKPTMSGTPNCVCPTKKCNPFENIYSLNNLVLLLPSYTSTSNISKRQQVKCSVLLCTAHSKLSHSVTEWEILFNL